MIYRKATNSDWEILLRWRNDELTRINSINNEIVSEQEHKKWFFNSLKSNNRIIYIFEDKQQLIGTVRIDIEENKKVISWTVAPEQRGKSYAKKMVKMISDTLNGLLKAIIKEDNIPSVKVAEYSGFSFEKKENNILIFKRVNDEDSRL